MKYQPRRTCLAMLAFFAAISLAVPAHLQSQSGCTQPPSGLADWWPGDGYANDIKGSHNGIVQGGLTFSPGLDGDAFTFNGSDAIATFGEAGNFGTADFTVVFWLRTTSTRGEAVIEKRPSCGNGHFWGIRKGIGIGAETDDGLGNYVAIDNPGPINDGGFHLIGLVRHGTNTLLYVDSMPPVVGTAANVADVGNAASLIVGDSVCDGVDGTNHLTGQLDEIQTFSRALSAAEIQAIYDAGGAGLCKNVTLSPASLNFGRQLVHTPSEPQIVTLTNPGVTALDISSIAASIDFLQKNNCGSSLKAGASCTLSVTFRPTSVCAKTGTLTITDSADDSPQTVALSGVGTVLTLSPTSLNFSNQAVGTTSAPQIVTLTNHAVGRALPIYAVRVSATNGATFVQTNTCGTSVAPGGSCTISVTFTPYRKGARTATLTIIEGGGDNAQTVALTGNTPTGTLNVATGLDCSNKLITTGGANDCHWTVNGNPAQVVAPGNADWWVGWVPNGPNSNWIAINANTCCDGPAPYSFNLVFDLSGSMLSGVSLSGLWSIDDSGTLSLNGQQIDAQGGLWGSLQPFSVPAGSPLFQQGLNTLTITMTATDNYLEGVRLEGTITGK